MADCDDRDTEIVIWTIRCLANPDCEGTAEALAAIVEKREQKARAEYLTEMNKTAKELLG